MGVLRNGARGGQGADAIGASTAYPAAPFLSCQIFEEGSFLLFVV